MGIRKIEKRPIKKAATPDSYVDADGNDVNLTGMTTENLPELCPWDDCGTVLRQKGLARWLAHVCNCQYSPHNSNKRTAKLNCYLDADGDVVNLKGVATKDLPRVCPWDKCNKDMNGLSLYRWLSHGRGRKGNPHNADTHTTRPCTLCGVTITAGHSITSSENSHLRRCQSIHDKALERAEKRAQGVLQDQEYDEEGREVYYCPHCDGYGHTERGNLARHIKQCTRNPHNLGTCSTCNDKFCPVASPLGVIAHNKRCKGTLIGSEENDNTPADSDVLPAGPSIEPEFEKEFEALHILHYRRDWLDRSGGTRPLLQGNNPVPAGYYGRPNTQKRLVEAAKVRLERADAKNKMCSGLATHDRPIILSFMEKKKTIVHKESTLTKKGLDPVIAFELEMSKD